MSAGDIAWAKGLGIRTAGARGRPNGEELCWRRGSISGLPCLKPYGHPQPCSVGS